MLNGFLFVMQAAQNIINPDLTLARQSMSRVPHVKSLETDTVSMKTVPEGDLRSGRV